jgi:hypothetical protein
LEVPPTPYWRDVLVVSPARGRQGIGQRRRLEQRRSLFGS